MIIEKNIHGAYVISDIVRGYRVSRQYYGYTKREAVKAFRAEARGEGATPCRAVGAAPDDGQ
jgi:hypothetical protein